MLLAHFAQPMSPGFVEGLSPNHLTVYKTYKFFACFLFHLGDLWSFCNISLTFQFFLDTALLFWYTQLKSVLSNMLLFLEHPSSVVCTLSSPITQEALTSRHPVTQLFYRTYHTRSHELLALLNLSQTLYCEAS